MSTSVWYTPDNWVSGLLRKKRMNEQIQANLKYLSERNIASTQVKSSGLDSPPTTSAPSISVSHTNNTGIVMAHFLGCGVSSVGGSDAWIDISVTLAGGAGTIYASSGTSTPTPRGVMTNRMLGANVEQEMVFSIPIVVPVGTHTYAAVYTVSGGVQGYSGIQQIIIEEYGLGLTNLHNWIEPKNWGAGENVTVPKLDRYVMERMQALYDRNWVYYKEVPAANITTVSTTFVPITAEKRFQIKLLTTGNDVRISMLFTAYTAVTTGSLGYLDILIDDDYYLSSLTNTPLSDGIFNATFVLNNPRPCFVEFILTDLEAGWHTFEPYIKTSIGTSAFALWLNNPVMIMAQEYCLTS